MRRVVEDFAAALEGRGGVAASDPALSPLLGLAHQLQSLPLGPAPAFRDSLRQRLVAVAAVTEPAPLPTPVDRAREVLQGWRLQRRLRAVAAAVAMLVVVSGVATVSSRSLPGEALYALKRASEWAQIELARNDFNRGKRELQHAGTRLDEVADLVGAIRALAPATRVAAAPLATGADPHLILDTLDDMDASTRRGVQLLFEASQERQSSEPLAIVRDFATRQQRELAAVLPALPDVARDRADASLQLLARIRKTSSAAITKLGSCPATGCTDPIDVSSCDCLPGVAPGSSSSGPGSAPAPAEPGGLVPGGTPIVPDTDRPPGTPSRPDPTKTKPAPTDDPAEPLPSPVASEIEDILEDLPPVPPPDEVNNPVPVPSTTPNVQPLPSLPATPSTQTPQLP